MRPDINPGRPRRDAEHARGALRARRDLDAAPETIEASLQPSEAALVDLGVPMGLVIASIHEKRDEVPQLPLSWRRAAALDARAAKGVT